MKHISRRTFLKRGAAAAAAAAFPLSAEAAAPARAAAVSPLCPTQYGPVQGKAQGSHLVWYGIPYAAAPVGDARWRAPQEPAGWMDPLDCTAPAPAAYQISSAPIGTEDCLRLDVYSAPSAQSRPVLVYLHGGGNQTGSSLALPGGDLVENDGCVFVSLSLIHI